MKIVRVIFIIFTLLIILSLTVYLSSREAIHQLYGDMQLQSDLSPLRHQYYYEAGMRLGYFEAKLGQIADDKMPGIIDEVIKRSEPKLTPLFDLLIKKGYTREYAQDFCSKEREKLRKILPMMSAMARNRASGKSWIAQMRDMADILSK